CPAAARVRAVSAPMPDEAPLTSAGRRRGFGVNLGIPLLARIRLVSHDHRGTAFVAVGDAVVGAPDPAHRAAATRTGRAENPRTLLECTRTTRVSSIS